MKNEHANSLENRVRLILAALKTSLAKDNIGYPCREILEARELYWEEIFIRLTNKKIYHIVVNHIGTPIGIGNSKTSAIFMAYCALTSIGQQETMSSMDWWDRVATKGFKHKKTMVAA